MSNDPWKAQLEALGALLRTQRTAADLSGDGAPRMRETEAAILRDAA